MHEPGEALNISEIAKENNKESLERKKISEEKYSTM